MDAPAFLVGISYTTVVPGILLVALVLTKLIFRDFRVQGPAVGLLGTYTLLFAALAYPIGISQAGVGWPANAWLDIYSPDVVIRALVDKKEMQEHESCSQYSCTTYYTYHIHAGGREWKVNKSTYEVIRQGERVEIAFKPHTKHVRYIAYNLAAGDRIRVAVGLAPSERKVFEDALLPEFKRSTGISVEFVQIDSDELLVLLREEAGGSGVPFDLLAIDNNSLAPLVVEGLVEELTAETQRIPDEVLDSMLPVTQFGGRTFFFPFRPNVQITFYNSDKFGQMGMEPPRTWDELLDCARMMDETERKGRLALKGVVGGPNAVQVTEFIWQAGGDPLVLNDEGSVRAFEFLQELAPYLSDRTPDAKFDTMNDYLASGDIYLGQNWAFGVQEIVVKKGKREIHAYCGWSGPEGEVHVLGGDVLAVPKGTANRTDALAFAEYLMSKEAQSTLAAELSWPSIRADAYDRVDPALKPYWDAINEAMSLARARPNVPYWKDVEQILGQAWTDIVVNGMDVEQRLNFYAAEIEKARQVAPRAQPRPRSVESPAPTYSTLGECMLDMLNHPGWGVSAKEDMKRCRELLSR
jgi:trehalose transport system substrate-binding protein